jgi:hypothetical protein
MTDERTGAELKLRSITLKKLINNSGAKHKEKSYACRGFICDKNSC